MKKIRGKLFLMGLTIIGMVSACNDIGSRNVDIVQIQGVSWACNVNTSYAVFGSSTETEKDPNLFLSVSEGDLLYMVYEDLQLYYRYGTEKGKLLGVVFDTVETVTAYVNDQLSYMELSETGSLDAFNSLSNTEIEQLSSLYINTSDPDKLYEMLQLHESALQGIGLILEGNFEPEAMYGILSMVYPEFLVLEDASKLPAPEQSLGLSNLELLWIDGKVPTLAKLAACCGNLESLIVADWDPEPGELIPLTTLSKLRSLTLAESGLTSLSALELPKSLRSLYLIGCDTLSDIRLLADLQNLNRLSLTQCSRIQDMAVLMEFEHLQWLSFPPSISQKDFSDLAAKHTGLKVVELIDCSEIRDLAPLQSLPELSTLVLHLEKEQLGMLDSLKQVDLLVLSDEVFEDNPEWVKDLRASLPETTIVPGSGLCLGSGWLLLVLPFFLIFRYMLRRKVYPGGTN